MSIDTTAANRATHRAHPNGRHRRHTLARKSAIAVIAAAAVAAGITLTPPAIAAPGQASVTDGGGQAGITDGGGQNGVNTEPTPPPAPVQTEPIYWVTPPAQYQNVPQQPLPNWTTVPAPTAPRPTTALPRSTTARSTCLAPSRSSH